MNGILCAYLRDTEPSTPSVDATALQPPSMRELHDVLGIEVRPGSARTRRRPSARCPDRPAGSTHTRFRPAGRCRTAAAGCRAPAASGPCRATPDRRSRGPAGAGVSFGIVWHWCCSRAASLTENLFESSRRSDPVRSYFADCGHVRLSWHRARMNPTSRIDVSIATTGRLPLSSVARSARRIAGRDAGTRNPPRPPPAPPARPDSSIGNACSAASMSPSRARVSGLRGVNSVQQSWSGMIEIG